MTRTWPISESPTCLTSPCFPPSLHFLLPVWSASHPALQRPPLSQLQCYLLRVASSCDQVQVHTAHHTAGQPTQGWGVGPRDVAHVQKIEGLGDQCPREQSYLGLMLFSFTELRMGGDKVVGSILGSAWLWRGCVNFLSPAATHRSWSGCFLWAKQRHFV